MKTTFIIALVCAALCGCGGYVQFNGNPGNGNAANSNANANTAANTTNANAAPANANANANANAAAKPADSGPKRISFTKGSDWASENITLAGGQSKQFVVGANEGQYLNVEASSPDIKLLMVTKKNVGVEQEGSNLSATLSGKGDYVFEVRNPGTKEVKTSIRVQITDEGGE